MDKLILNGVIGVAIGIGGDVAQVTDMSDLVVGSAMRLAEGVEVRASRRAAIGVVTELVNVEAPQGVLIEALQVIGNGGGRGSILLLKSDLSADGRVTAENSNFNWNIGMSVSQEH